MPGFKNIRHEAIDQLENTVIIDMFASFAPFRSDPVAAFGKHWNMSLYRQSTMLKNCKMGSQARRQEGNYVQQIMIIIMCTSIEHDCVIKCRSNMAGKNSQAA
jgi:hypothetical protein